MMLRFTIVIAIAILSVACGLGPDLSKDRVPRSPSPTPFIPDKPIGDYIRDGGAAYAAGNFSEASVHYKKAFEIEQREQKLEKKERRELVANAATAFARAGDTKNARLAVAYGLSKDFDAPMYHYALACSYASEGDESTALYHLRAAFGFRHKLLPGEKMADPIKDTCFTDFAENDTFKKAVTEMKRSPLRDQD
jgi:tetratricopeptide (TPR) repeat protein